LSFNTDKDKLIKELINLYGYFSLDIDEDLKTKIIFPAIDFLLKKKEIESILNEEKILIIFLLLLNKLKNIDVPYTPEVLIFMSAIIWHSTIKRPNELEYITQENLDKKFRMSIIAVRYLRKEMGITEKKYKDLNDFYQILINSTPLYKQCKVDFNEVPNDLYKIVREIIINDIISRKKAKSAIECATFLFFNQKKDYTKNEIFYVVKDFLNLQGPTPRASFNSDIGRYTDNADVKIKRKPLLFTITNIEEKENKIKLIPKIIKKIEKLLSEKKISRESLELNYSNEKEVWRCPKESCENFEIYISRNDKNIIDGKTYKEIIIHFLQHLTKDNVYFGSTDIYEIFLNNCSRDILSNEDKMNYPDYGRSPTIIWKTQIRTSLNALKIDGYITTDDLEKIPEDYNKDIQDKRKFRSRKRTEKFFKEYDFYNDWSLYPLRGGTENPPIWHMIKEALEILAYNSKETFSISDIIEYILKKYGNIDENSLNNQIRACTVNDPSRIRFLENKKPYTANSQYNVLYQIEKRKGEFELYNQEKHGIWEIKEDRNGNLIVYQKAQIKISCDKSLEFVYQGLNLLNQIKEALLLKGQVILMGPPGTSKSYLAEQIAIQLSEGIGNNIKMVQFHPAYAYEDFVECNIIEKGEIKPKEKIFRKFCQESINEAKKGNKCVLIIDEINRGNVERIFGELIYGLEKRNKAIPTIYFEGELTIPDNLYIIGTMNTVDLSIANIDAALRRRFYIIEIEPNKNVLKNWLNYHLKEQYEEFQKDLIEFMENLNEKIEQNELMGKYRTIGHAIFMLKAIKDRKKLDEIKKSLDMEWKYMIRPTIIEYLNFPNDKDLKPFDEIFEKFFKKEL